MITYVDTSTLVALIIEEPGSHVAALVWDQSSLVMCTRLTFVEASAALAAAHRAGRLTSRQLSRAGTMLDDLWQQVSILEVDEALMRRASELAVQFRLRGYDAVHLAAADLAKATVFGTGDRALQHAARDLGMYVADSSW